MHDFVFNLELLEGIHEEVKVLFVVHARHLDALVAVVVVVNLANVELLLQLWRAARTNVVKDVVVAFTLLWLWVSWRGRARGVSGRLVDWVQRNKGGRERGGDITEAGWTTRDFSSK